MNEEFRIEESNTIDNYLIFYTEKETISDGEIKIHLKQKLIPAFLKDKFLKDFNVEINLCKLTSEDIDSFLERNTGNNNMKTQIIIDAKMSNEQCDALVSEIERVAEVIGINVKTEASYKSVYDNIGLLKKQIYELKNAENNNHAMTDNEKKWVDLHLGTVIERLEKIFYNSDENNMKEIENNSNTDEVKKAWYEDDNNWIFVGDRQPKDTFMCIVKMFNEFSDTWSTGTGIFDNGKWEATDSSGESWPIRYWRRCPEFEAEGCYVDLKEDISKIYAKNNNVKNSDEMSGYDPSRELVGNDPSKEMSGYDPSRELIGNDPSGEMSGYDPSREFLPGDVVMLKIGGPRMGVSKVFNKLIECIYFVDGNVVREKFPINLLVNINII
jgi:uncharacterized protein YodC (DUF2158 family)